MRWLTGAVIGAFVIAMGVGGAAIWDISQPRLAVQSPIAGEEDICQVCQRSCLPNGMKECRALPADVTTTDKYGFGLKYVYQVGRYCECQSEACTCEANMLGGCQPRRQP